MPGRVSELLPENDAIQPVECRDEDELQLRCDGTRDAKEQVVEPPVVEVILDSRAADPANATVDDDQLAMVDVPEPVEVPPSGAACHDGPDRSPQLDRPDDPDVDARCKQPRVKRAAAWSGSDP